LARDMYTAVYAYASWIKYAKESFCKPNIETSPNWLLSNVTNYSHIQITCHLRFKTDII
jgi:hypothetical protein